MSTPPRKQSGQGKGPRRIDGACLDVRSASAFYGGTEKQVRGMIARRVIPFRRLGGRIIFLKVELEQWIVALPGCTPDEAKKNLGIRHG